MNAFEIIILVMFTAGGISFSWMYYQLVAEKIPEQIDQAMGQILTRAIQNQETIQRKILATQKEQIEVHEKLISQIQREKEIFREHFDMVEGRLTFASDQIVRMGHENASLRAELSKLERILNKTKKRATNA